MGRVHLDFVLKLRQLADDHGKRLNLWGDLVLQHPEVIPDPPKDVVMLNWEYSGDPDYAESRIRKSAAFAEAGLDWIACPGTNGWVRHTPSLSRMMSDIRMFGSEGLRHGAIGLLVTDWGDAGHRTDRHFDRLDPHSPVRFQ